MASVQSPDKRPRIEPGAPEETTPPHLLVVEVPHSEGPQRYSTTGAAGPSQTLVHFSTFNQIPAEYWTQEQLSIEQACTVAQHQMQREYRMQQTQSWVLGLPQKHPDPLSFQSGRAPPCHQVASNSTFIAFAHQLQPGVQNCATSRLNVQFAQSEESAAELLPPQPAAQAEDKWVQCDLCEKWRTLLPSISLYELPEMWTCSQNWWDPSRQCCEAPEVSLPCWHTRLYFCCTTTDVLMHYKCADALQMCGCIKNVMIHYKCADVKSLWPFVVVDQPFSRLLIQKSKRYWGFNGKLRGIYDGTPQ